MPLGSVQRAKTVRRVEEVDRLLHPEGELSGFVCHRAVSFLEVAGSTDNGERHAAGILLNRITP